MGTDTLSMRAASEHHTGTAVSLPVAVVATTAGEVRALLHDAVDHGTGPVVLDLGAVETFDVVGLGVVMGAHRRAAARGRHLRVVRPSRRVSAVLRITGVDRVLCPRER
jgi:anti-sigma B factor antagonist